jgi:hypothetical protein
MAETKLAEHLTILHGQYLEKRKEDGGTASGWRSFGMGSLKRDPALLALYSDELILMALTKKWQEPPRKRGPDLFSMAGYVVPDTLTRISKTEFADGDDIEEDVENKFEKVDHRYATVNDLIADSNIKLRKAAQSSARANACAIAADVALKRAKGDLNVFLRDIADKA